MRYLLNAGIAFTILFTSCEKDIPVALPLKGDAQHGAVEMGEEYKNQVFFSLETGNVIHVSEINAWHLAFEAAPDGYHVFMNGGADVFVYNTHKTDFASVTTAPDEFGKDWQYDSPSGSADSTAISNWMTGDDSKNEVYIIRLDDAYKPNDMKKLRIISVTEKEYTIEVGDLSAKGGRIMTIPKDEAYNYSYFSFDKDGYVLQMEPPKESWDIVFTRYRIIYYHMDNFPYTVNGALLNPYKTKGSVDSTKAFSELTAEQLATAKLTSNRDVIGHDWKTYNFTKERYDINKDKCFLIQGHSDKIWKLRFLDFYNKMGKKGSPSFEFQRIN